MSTGAHGTADSKDCWLCRDQRKSRQDWKRKQRQSASERIIKKVKGDDAKRRRTEQQQRMANHRARETGKQRYQQVISIIGSLLSVNIFVFSSPVKLQTVDSKLHTSSTYYQSARRTSCACAYSYTATRGIWVNLHLVTVYLSLSFTTTREGCTTAARANRTAQ